ncbi:RagB/SusD family nutrient uptake outer membrane protein [Chryseosolibacter indicus]|uniref:RagB/SusD family nutrient uptake outer membrane protein n=1 Tax=Chryseosolibacter indicus TaxID=2782351 RepID=A0ABS5VMC2_9BACT|nr:RagB/SusD family nutrient uptake outer membrane protein [Chryseosolibacter indicus]MBT1702600.1 RagB/SusD family nutrient uptake outer membrane protein [Chryseosolibacter indicus]
MKKQIINLSVTIILIILSSCDNFLEVAPKGLNLESNYYKTPEEVFAGIVAVYDVVGWQGGNLVTKVGATMAASDDHHGGGEGAGDKNFTAWDDFTLTPAQGPQEELWKKGFSGIFRANVVLEKLPTAPIAEGLRRRYTAELKFLRAHFNFDLVRLFNNIPLLLSPVSPDKMYDIEQVAPALVYQQIERDLTEAIPDLPETVTTAAEGGRATEGTARALLGKVYLQQEKFALAAEQLEIVNGTPGSTNKFGYKLLTNFGDLWKSTSEFKFNSESIFEVGFTNTSAGDWGCTACTEGNLLNIMSGPRGYNPLAANAPDYISGWSYFPVTQSLYDLMKSDPRFIYTIADLKTMKANGIADYTPGAQDTGYFIEKFLGRKSNSPTGLPGAQELNYPQNMYEIRLADTYLMEAEARIRGNLDAGTAGTRSYTLLNAVRQRVGLTAVDATLQNIKTERRLELAGEGHRWFDLVRWGDAATVLAPNFVAGKHEHLPIPLNELTNTKLQQSKEWGGTL